jgi:hypothetical protein
MRVRSGVGLRVATGVLLGVREGATVGVTCGTLRLQAVRMLAMTIQRRWQRTITLPYNHYYRG